MDQTQNADQTISCRDCKTDFVFTVGEQAFFAERGFRPPVRCKGCRDLKKAQQGGGTGGNANTYPARTTPNTQPTPEVTYARKGGRDNGGWDGRTGGGGRKGGGRRRRDEGDTWE